MMHTHKNHLFHSNVSVREQRLIYLDALPSEVQRAGKQAETVAGEMDGKSLTVADARSRVGAAKDTLDLLQAKFGKKRDISAYIREKRDALQRAYEGKVERVLGRQKENNLQEYNLLRDQAKNMRMTWETWRKSADSQIAFQYSQIITPLLTTDPKPHNFAEQIAEAVSQIKRIADLDVSTHANRGKNMKPAKTKELVLEGTKNDRLKEQQEFLPTLRKLVNDFNDAVDTKDQIAFNNAKAELLRQKEDRLIGINLQLIQLATGEYKKTMPKDGYLQIAELLKTKAEIEQTVERTLQRDLSVMAAPRLAPSFSSVPSAAARPPLAAPSARPAAPPATTPGPVMSAPPSGAPRPPRPPESDTKVPVEVAQKQFTDWLLNVLRSQNPSRATLVAACNSYIATCPPCGIQPFVDDRGQLCIQCLPGFGPNRMWPTMRRDFMRCGWQCVPNRAITNCMFLRPCARRRNVPTPLEPTPDPAFQNGQPKPRLRMNGYDQTARPAGWSNVDVPMRSPNDGGSRGPYGVGTPWYNNEVRQGRVKRRNNPTGRSY